MHSYHVTTMFNVGFGNSRIEAACFLLLHTNYNLVNSPVHGFHHIPSLSSNHPSARTTDRYILAFRAGVLITPAATPRRSHATLSTPVDENTSLNVCNAVSLALKTFFHCQNMSPSLPPLPCSHLPCPQEPGPHPAMVKRWLNLPTEAK